MEERQWALAVSTASSLNSKWSSPEDRLPFRPKDFMPLTQEEQKAAEKERLKAAEFQEQMLELRFMVMTQQLTKDEHHDISKN